MNYDEGRSQSHHQWLALHLKNDLNNKWTNKQTNKKDIQKRTNIIDDIQWGRQRVETTSTLTWKWKSSIDDLWPLLSTTAKWPRGGQEEKDRRMKMRRIDITKDMRLSTDSKGQTEERFWGNCSHRKWLQFEFALGWLGVKWGKIFPNELECWEWKMSSWEKKDNRLLG